MTAPLLAAHRIETPEAAAAAHSAGADLLEIDVHLRHGVLEVRHPRRHGPVLWDREGVRRARGASATLGPLLAALPDGAEPMIDLKGGAPVLAREALASVRDAGVGRVTLTSRRWALLDGLAGEDGVRVAYSAAGRRRAATVAASSRSDRTQAAAPSGASRRSRRATSRRPAAE